MSFPEFARKHVTVTAVLCAAIVAGATACGTGTGPGTGGAASASARPSTRPTDPLSGLSSDQIVAQALSNLKLASAVNVSGNFISSKLSYTLNVTRVRSVGCQGSVSVGGEGSMSFLWIGKTFWIKADNQFFTSSGVTDPGTLRMLDGRWITTSSAKGPGKEFSQFCDFSQLIAAGFSSGSSDPNLKRLSQTTIGGTLVQELGDPGQPGTIYVSVARQPEVVRILDQEKEGGTLNFGSYNQPVRLTAPSASDTIDGSEVGL